MIKETYDPELDVTYVTEDVPPSRINIIGWYNGQPNAEATQAVVDQHKKG